MSDAFDDVRTEPDALVRARRATELIGVYQQRSAELARLRRLAIEQAARERGMTMAAVAAEIGLSKGRITQIRQSAPPPERGLFGVGPVTVAVPLRAMPGRDLPVISAEDSIAAERMTDLLTGMSFAVTQFRIPVDGAWQPTGDAVAICGPKSSSVTAAAIAGDPHLSFEPDALGRWTIRDRATAEPFHSGMDLDPPSSKDVAYVGRLPRPDGYLFVIAGVHAIGSVGAVEHLARVLPELYQSVGERPWSGVIASDQEGVSITATSWKREPQAF